MGRIISCCGVVCSDCESYPKECKGCPEIEGNVFWLEYTGESICSIYECCIHKSQFKHCGTCKLLPCEFYFKGDPTKSEDENALILEKQIEQLKLEINQG